MVQFCASVTAEALGIQLAMLLSPLSNVEFKITVPDTKPLPVSRVTLPADVPVEAPDSIVMLPLDPAAPPVEMVIPPSPPCRLVVLVPPVEPTLTVLLPAVPTLMVEPFRLFVVPPTLMVVPLCVIPELPSVFALLNNAIVPAVPLTALRLLPCVILVTFVIGAALVILLIVV